LGPNLDPQDLARFALPRTQYAGNEIRGSVIHIDHFGNVVTSIRLEQVEEQSNWQVELADTGITLHHISRTFSDVPPGHPVAYTGSDGFLEIAIRNGSAAAEWNVQIGAPIKLRRAQGA
jgi:S-adenosylmethionine hydrolase